MSLSVLPLDIRQRAPLLQRMPLFVQEDHLVSRLEMRLLQVWSLAACQEYTSSDSQMKRECPDPLDRNATVSSTTAESHRICWPRTDDNSP